MERSFWIDRWQENKIGFHEGAPNRYLVERTEWLAGCRRILVPLCGKSEDLAYLASRGHDVIGVELVEDAVKQFFDEHGTVPETEASGDLVIYRAGAITVIAGDFFSVTHDHIGPIDGIFDRAAMVALPPDLRARYIAHLRDLGRDATRELLVSIEYPPESSSGPPFSVEEPEVRKTFAGASITVVGSGFDPQGRLEGRMFERCYEIELTRQNSL
jgi:thiopurine S-methyltransferase